jgi:hypothetical protein
VDQLEDGKFPLVGLVGNMKVTRLHCSSLHDIDFLGAPGGKSTRHPVMRLFCFRKKQFLS